MEDNRKEVWIIEVGKDANGNLVTEISSKHLISTTGTGDFVIVGDKNSHGVEYYERTMVHYTRESAEKAVCAFTD